MVLKTFEIGLRTIGDVLAASFSRRLRLPLGSCTISLNHGTYTCKPHDTLIKNGLIEYNWYITLKRITKLPQVPG